MRWYIGYSYVIWDACLKGLWLCITFDHIHKIIIIVPSITKSIILFKSQYIILEKNSWYYTK